MATAARWVNGRCTKVESDFPAGLDCLFIHSPKLRNLPLDQKQAPMNELNTVQQKFMKVLSKSYQFIDGQTFSLLNLTLSLKNKNAKRKTDGFKDFKRCWAALMLCSRLDSKPSLEAFAAWTAVLREFCECLLRMNLLRHLVERHLETFWKVFVFLKRALRCLTQCC